MRYSRVPAFDSLIPSTRASSPLDIPAWNFRATISRSRAGSLASADWTAVRRSATSAPSPAS